MLKLDHVGTLDAVELTLDDYVPFRLEASGAVTEVVYWRAKPSNRSLLEVGLDRRDGKLCSVTLVSVDASHVCALKDVRPIAQGNAEPGFPFFELSPWGNAGNSFGERFVDEGIELCLFVGERSARLQLGEYRHATKSVRAGRVELLFDDRGYFIAIELPELSAEELKLLRSASR